MPELYLGQWEWNTDTRERPLWEMRLGESTWNAVEPDEPFWQMPRADIGLGNLDLRSLPQCGSPGPVAQGYSLFVLSERDDTIGIHLGDLLSHAGTPLKKALKSALGLGENIVADTPLEILWELLTKHADPTGQTRWKPLMPKIDGVMELILGGFSLVKEEPYNPTDHPLVLDVVREDYRRNREYDLSVGSDHYRRYLQAAMEKYKVPWQELIPTGLPLETPLPHGTTLGDTFVDTDNTELSAHTATGPNGGFGWTELIVDIEIVSNTAENQNAATAAALARADSDLASDDHYCQVDIVQQGGLTADGTIYRKDSTSTATYYHARLNRNGTDNVQLYKVITGTFTQLGSNAAVTVSIPDTIKGQADGSTIKAFFNGTEKISQTNSDITGSVRTGFRMRHSSGWTGTKTRFASFEAADLVAAGNPWNAYAQQ